MKKTLIAMAALAAAGVASAQSSVTMYGVVDLAISHYSGQNSWTGMSSGGINSSRIGFKGTEDLGGGLKANFQLEADVNPANGAGSSTSTTNVDTVKGFAFSRGAWASLSGGFGELRLGRDYTPTFYADANYDPFGVNGVGTNAIFGSSVAAGGGFKVNHLRASNAVSYFLPGNLGGFNGQLTYAFNNTATKTAVAPNGDDDGKYIGGRLGYDAGPISATVAYAQSKAKAIGDVKTTSLAGSYNLGVAKLMAEFSEDKLGAAGLNAKKKGYLLGAVVPVGAGEVHASYVVNKVTADGSTGDNKFTEYALGYVYNLSKRTALYGTYAHVSNKGVANYGFGAAGGVTTAAGGSSNGYDLGIRHSF